MVRSLRWRIQIWHGVILAVVIVLFGAITYVQQRRSCTATIDNELRSAAEVLTGQLRSASAGTLQGLLTANGESRDAAAQKLFDDLQVPRTFAPRRYHHGYEHPCFVIRSSDGELVKVSGSAPKAAFQRMTVLPLGAGRPSLVPSILDQGRDENQECVAEGPQGMLVLVGRNVHSDFRNLKNLAYLLFGSGIVVFAVGLLGGWSLSRATMRPIAEITRAAAGISEANLSNRCRRNRCGATAVSHDAERNVRSIAVGIRTAGAVYNGCVSRITHAFDRGADASGVGVVKTSDAGIIS